MRVQIDWTRCDAHGLCAALAPHRIALDEWGFPVIAPAPLSEAEARRVVAACPALALRVQAEDR
jgi:ferredoxin